MRKQAWYPALGGAALALGAFLLLLSGCSQMGNTLGANVRLSTSDYKVVAVLTPTSYDPLNAQGNPAGYGSHNGELQNLQIQLVYLNPPSYNTNGHAIYYIGQPMQYELKVTNIGNCAFNCLDFSVQHQYYDTGSTWDNYDPSNPSGYMVNYSKGEPMPGTSTSNWNNVNLPSQSMVVLQGTYNPPYSTAPGTDQTAVLIKHCNTPGQSSEHDALMYYNPEQGVFDPPPSH